MARDGIDFLRGIDQLYIQQTVELSDCKCEKIWIVVMLYLTVIL